MRAEARIRAREDQDPAMLVGPDIIHFAELLMREDHPVLGKNFKFWGKLADKLNSAMHLPTRADYSHRHSEFNSWTALAYGYLDMSEAPVTVRIELLTRYFPPVAVDPFNQL